MEILPRAWWFATGAYMLGAAALAATGSGLRIELLWSAAYVIVLPVGYVVVMMGLYPTMAVLSLLFSVSADPGPVEAFVSSLAWGSLFAAGAFANVMALRLAVLTGTALLKLCRCRVA